MAEESTSFISNFTGLPKENIKVESPMGEDPGKSFISNFTGKDVRIDTGGPVDPFVQATKVQNVSGIYTDPLESYREYGVPLSPFADWNEERAQRQTTWEKWTNGLTKAGITTLGAIYENTIGVFAGLGSLATGGEYYDNFVGRQVDSVNDWAQENMPNYYTQAEINGSILENMGTANFWADKVANGVGYTLGSIATMFLGTGELGLAGKAIGGVAKAASTAGKAVGIGGKAISVLDDAALLGSKQLALYKAGKAVETGAKLEKLASMARLSTASQRLAVATQMSLAESSVEARETRKRFIEEQVAKWEEENPGQTMSSELMADIEESADAAGNVAFAINLPILATTNIIMFGKMFKGAAVGERLAYRTVRNAEGKLVEAGMDGKLATAWTKSKRILGKPVQNMLTEGFQEGSQFAASEFSRSYYGDKFYDGVGDMSKSLSESLSRTFGTKEGLENIVIGAIVGGGTGAVSRIAGVDRKLAKARTENTAKIIDYVNRGGLTKVIENMESNEYNIALVNYIEENNKILESEESTPVQKAIAKQRAERARTQLIRSEVARLDKIGATDYLMEQLDDAASMPEDEFKKAFGYRMNSTLKFQTGKTQAELVEDVKKKAELSLKRSKQVQDILAKYQPKNTLLPKLIASFQNEETKNNKDLQRLVVNQYANMLHGGLMDIDVIDEQIDDIYDHLVSVSPALGQISKEDFAYKIKVGEVSITPEGNLKFMTRTTNDPTQKLYDKLNEIFQAKYSLNPADAEDFQNAANELARLVGRREKLNQAFDNIRRNPEEMDLYIEAEYLRRKADEDKANADRAAQAIENAETADELREVMPEDAPEELVAQAEAKIEELEQLEKEEVAKFSTMSDAQIDAIDEDTLPPIALSALAKEKDKREKKRIAEKTLDNQPGQLQRRTEFTPTASFEEAQQELSDAEAAALGDISVSSGGFIFTIGGRTYLNLNEDPTDAIIYDSMGNRVGIRLTDAATSNEITWMLDDQNENDSAVADTLTYAILLQASSIRSDENQKNLSASEAKAIAQFRGEVIAEDVTQKHREELEAQRDTLKGKDKKLEIPSIEDPEALTQAEAEFEKIVALSDIGKTAGLTDGQIRAQIEVIKQDLIEIEEILEAERQLAMEAGFTKEEFNKDGQVKTLNAIKKSHKALLTKKIKELAARKKKAITEQSTDNVEEVIEAEIEQTPTEEEVDEITKGEKSKISRLQDEIAQLKVVAAELKKIVDGVYPGQDVEAAKKELRNTQNKIKRREENIRKSNELIQRINEERQLEKLRQNGDVTEGAGTAAEGQEPQTTNIDPREGSTAEGLDGTTTEQELEEIRRQREELEKIDRTMDNPEDGPTDVEENPFIETVVVSEGNIDAPLVKGEVKSSPDFTEQIVDDNGNTSSVMLGQQVEGDTVMLFPEMLTDNSVIPTGTVVTFEVNETTDWWNSEDPRSSNNKKDLTEDRYWEQVPIYIVAVVNGNPEKIGMLAAYNGTTGSSRQEIYNLFKKGLTPTATINKKLFNSTNVVNARTESVVDQNGNIIPGDIFFYPASQLVKPNQTPTIAVVRIKDNIRVLVDQNGNELPFEAGNLALGQVAMVVEDPNGNPAIIVASTKDMTEEGRTIAVNHIIKESPEASLFGEIVGLNELPADVPSEDAAIEYSETEDPTQFDFEKFMSMAALTDGRILFTFYSKSAKKLVRINEEELKKALLGQSFIFSFSEAAKNERGWNTLVTVQEDKTLYPAIAPNLKQEFLDIIMQKKFQVSIGRMMNTEVYVSPITGIEYPSYFDYLTSTQEFEGKERTEGKGANVILATDSPGNAYNSPFYDIGIEFSRLMAMNGGAATQAEIETNRASKSLDSIDSKAPQQAPQPTQQSSPTTDKKADIEKTLYGTISGSIPLSEALPNGVYIDLGNGLFAYADKNEKIAAIVDKNNNYLVSKSFWNPNKNAWQLPNQANLKDDAKRLGIDEAVYIKKYQDAVDSLNAKAFYGPGSLSQSTTTPAVQPQAPVSAPMQTASQVNVEEWDADLFGAAPVVEQKPVSSSTELPAFLANYAVTPEQNAQLRAEHQADMQKEMQGLNPNGTPMQDLRDLLDC